MKKLIPLAILLINFIPFNSGAQVYEHIYANSTSEVQQQIDMNKMSGVEMLSNVKTHHNVGIVGVGMNNHSTLENLLNNESSIISYTLSADASTLQLYTEATFTKEMLSELLTQVNGIIAGYSAEYSVEQ